MILTVTPNPAVDQTIEMPEPLESDTIQRSTGARFDSGGNGINVSQFVSALSGETVATGVVGGFTGYFLRQDLGAFEVPTDFCNIDPETTRMNTTVLSPEAEYHLNQSGPSVGGDAAVEELIATIREHDPETVDIGGSLPPGMEATHVDEIAAAGDWDTGIDVHGELLEDLEETYEFIKPNEIELQNATGIEVTDIDDCAEAARTLQKRGFERVIASMGGEGAMMVTPDKTLFAPALDVEVVDTVGAGDSLFAAVLWAYSQGWDDETALRAGVATSSKIVGIAGTSVDSLDVRETMESVKVWSLRA